MGISAAPPDRQRRPARVSGVPGWFVMSLAIASLASFALAAVVDGGWLVVALGAALLVLAVLMPRA
jgi:hypothetical protein